jgi:glycerol-3-phosphate dehydrogenase
VAVIGAGVVGCAVALALARRGVHVALLEAEDEPALGASGSNSGMLHTGFYSPPHELETELILASLPARETLLRELAIPVRQCGASMIPRDDGQRRVVAGLADVARQNQVAVIEHDDGSLEIPGEWITDPVAYTYALAAEAERQGAELRTRFCVAGVTRTAGRMTLRAAEGEHASCRFAVNCSGLHADTVARLFGDDSFSIYPRKGEFLVFDPPSGDQLERILLPVPSERTRGVLVFPTIDGKIVAGPTAVDLEDKSDRTLRSAAREEIMASATELYPELDVATPIAAYVGLRPAGRGVNYLIGRSGACEALVNVAAVRSTGLSASLGIGDAVARLVGGLGVTLRDALPLIGGDLPAPSEAWWSRAARHAAVA